MEHKKTGCTLYMAFECKLCQQTFREKGVYSLHLQSKVHFETKKRLRHEFAVLSKREIDAKYGHDTVRLAYIMGELRLTKKNSNLFGDRPIQMPD